MKHKIEFICHAKYGVGRVIDGANVSTQVMAVFQDGHTRLVMRSKVESIGFYQDTPKERSKVLKRAKTIMYYMGE